MIEIYHVAQAKGIIINAAKANDFPMIGIAEPRIKELLDILYSQGFVFAGLHPGDITNKVQATLAQGKNVKVGSSK